MNPFDYSQEQAYFINTAPPAITGGAGLVGGHLDGVTSHLGSNAPNLLLGVLVLALVGYAWYTRSINR